MEKKIDKKLITIKKGEEITKGVFISDIRTQKDVIALINYCIDRNMRLYKDGFYDRHNISDFIKAIGDITTFKEKNLDFVINGFNYKDQTLAILENSYFSVYSCDEYMTFNEFKKAYNNYKKGEYRLIND